MKVARYLRRVLGGSFGGIVVGRVVEVRCYGVLVEGVVLSATVVGVVDVVVGVVDVVVGGAVADGVVVGVGGVVVDGVTVVVVG